ncbi:transketolase [Paramaledivibacter caminithermalis]|jgi:transketolase|uniref:Transketolase n=1 Tax=Paramaledivibacter caminithermalis (strain DSM 15212 / CIP 107654 / DViRD3) TaxID=1121301 RepID=A0A1M6SP85_PARC5|nr:transketolase [Paramaledivibacter caminithermalis]SHK46532.1 transketolase [Paramaledivibacter caminithermalis DSM 15212]
MKNDIRELYRKASQIRLDTFESIVQAGSGHLGGSFSVIEILSALYFEVMELDEENKDNLILSKGHGAPALYSTLVNKGLCERGLLSQLRKHDSPFQGHPDCRKLPLLSTSSGSLGQGLSIGIGMAIADKLSNSNRMTYVILGDGELNEGQIWESIMFASANKIGNLIALVDRNNLQLDGRTEDVLDMGNLKDKWKAFGWSVLAVDGHRIEEIVEAINNFLETNSNTPKVIICNTVKGKGISYMENNYLYHGKIPSGELLEDGRNELRKEISKWD